MAAPPRARSAPDRRAPRGPSVRLVLAWICLIIPFIGTLWVSSYARRTPTLFGFPFFYWYQLMWVFIAAGLTVTAYLLYRSEEARRREARTGQRQEGEL